MDETNQNPKKDKQNFSGTERQDDNLDIGNELSMGSVSGAKVSDFDPDKDSPETEEREYREEDDSGDDAKSGDNGINPAPHQVDSGGGHVNTNIHVENADEDKLNPFPDELKPDENDEHFNSTWMISGRSKKI